MDKAKSFFTILGLGITIGVVVVVLLIFVVRATPKSIIVGGVEFEIPTATSQVQPPSTSQQGEQPLLPVDETLGLVLNFDGSLDGADGELGYGSSGLSFVPGYSGQAVLFDKENTLYYLTGNNISPKQGAIEFWLQPLWNGKDNQDHVFFEIGDTWFNRMMIIKDGANNFRFLVWSSENEYDAAYNASDWVATDWHKVRVTWQNDSISLYLDGILRDTQTSVVMADSLSYRFYVGSSAREDMYAQAIIDEFTIYP